MAQIMREILRKNKYLRAVYRAYMGKISLDLDYHVNFKPRWGDEIGHKQIADLLCKELPLIAKNIKGFRELSDNLNKVQVGVNNFDIRWENGFLPAYDGLTLMWAAMGTKNYFIEVGSGNSTKFIKSSIVNSNSAAKLISIDPSPRAEIDQICDQVIRRPLEDVDLEIFTTLKQGDTVFIDNSHRSFMNSDVTTVMLDILPQLKPGVRIGIHDIFLPFDYFQSWSERGYNEQYLLACYLIANPKYFRIDLPSFWAFKRGLFEENLDIDLTFLDKKLLQRAPSSFWMTKR